MKHHQALFSLKDKSKKLICRLLQILFGTFRVKKCRFFSINFCGKESLIIKLKGVVCFLSSPACLAIPQSLGSDPYGHVQFCLFDKADPTAYVRQYSTAVTENYPDASSSLGANLLGPYVQSIVSLTSLLRGQLIKYFRT